MLNFLDPLLLLVEATTLPFFIISNLCTGIMLSIDASTSIVPAEDRLTVSPI